MPLGVLMLDHFADSIAVLELDCIVCDRHRTLRTDKLVAKHSRFVSLEAPTSAVAFLRSSWFPFDD